MSNGEVGEESSLVAVCSDRGGCLLAWCAWTAPSEARQLVLIWRCSKLMVVGTPQMSAGRGVDTDVKSCVCVMMPDVYGKPRLYFVSMVRAVRGNLGLVCAVIRSLIDGLQDR